MRARRVSGALVETRNQTSRRYGSECSQRTPKSSREATNSTEWGPTPMVSLLVQREENGSTVPCVCARDSSNKRRSHELWVGSREKRHGPPRRNPPRRSVVLCPKWQCSVPTHTTFFWGSTVVGWFLQQSFFFQTKQNTATPDRTTATNVLVHGE